MSVFAEEKLLKYLRIHFNDSSEAVPEERLRAVLDAFNMMDPVSDTALERILLSYIEERNTSMNIGVPISDPGVLPWVRERNIQWQQWAAYRKWLEEDLGRGSSTSALHESLNEILDHLGNPEDHAPWQRKALVIGDVQSGKTSTYIGLINKAIDAGYKLVVLLTGHTDTLRKQGQFRVNEGVTGDKSTQEFTNPSKLSRNAGNERIGIGRHMDRNVQLKMMTNPSLDFNKAASQQGESLLDPSNVVLFVTKKNKSVLDAINTWLARGNDGPVDLPFLIIDDESDYGSVNTNKPDNNPTAINDAIKRLLKLSTRSSYVGFTATPFANIFINDEEEDDLFPRDLIYFLDSPSSYIGAARIFGEKNDTEIKMYHSDESEDFFPFGHQKDLEVAGLPESLLDAIRAFMISNAIRDFRKESKPYRSMLINVSRNIEVHRQISEQVTQILRDYKNAIAFARTGQETNQPKSILGLFHETFVRRFSSASETWEDVVEYLDSANSPVDVVTSNSDMDRDFQLPERYIAIGGDKLSRGLTLEGLSTSYFYRRVSAADTLMQMGRWFGYRPTYEDLCMVWMPEVTKTHFRSATDSFAELRRLINQMRNANDSPKNFGIAIKHHPDALAITAANKLRHSEQAEWNISMRGRTFETPVLPGELKALKSNQDEVNKLLTSLAKDQQPTELKPGNRLLWSGVSHKTIASFIEQFQTSGQKNRVFFEGNVLADYISKATAEDLREWDVVLMGGSGDNSGYPDWTFSNSLPQRKVVLKTFSDKSKEVLISGERHRVGGSVDLKALLDDQGMESWEKATVEERKGIFPSLLKRAALLIYPVRPGEPSEASDEDWKRSGVMKQVLPTDFAFPLVALAVTIPGEIYRAEDKDLYQMNSVQLRFMDNFPESSDRFTSPDEEDELDD